MEGLESQHGHGNDTNEADGQARGTSSHRRESLRGTNRGTSPAVGRDCNTRRALLRSSAARATGGGRLGGTGLFGNRTAGRGRNNFHSMNAGIALNATSLWLGARNPGDGHSESLGRSRRGGCGGLLSPGDGADGGVPWDCLGGDMSSRAVGDLRGACSNSIRASSENSAGGPRNTGLGGRLAGWLGRFVSSGDRADGCVGWDCLGGNMADRAVGNLRRASRHGMHRSRVDNACGQDDGLRRSRASTVSGILPDSSGSCDRNSRASGDRLS